MGHAERQRLARRNCKWYLVNALVLQRAPIDPWVRRKAPPLSDRQNLFLPWLYHCDAAML